MLACCLGLTLVLVLHRLQTQLSVDAWKWQRGKTQEVSDWECWSVWAFMGVCLRVKVTCNLGADLHVLQQYCQRFQVLCCPAGLYFCKLAVHLTETLTIQPTHKHRCNYGQCPFIWTTFLIIIMIIKKKHFMFLIFKGGQKCMCILTGLWDLWTVSPDCTFHPDTQSSSAHSPPHPFLEDKKQRNTHPPPG